MVWPMAIARVPWGLDPEDYQDRNVVDGEANTWTSEP